MTAASLAGRVHVFPELEAFVAARDGGRFPSCLWAPRFIVCSDSEQQVQGAEMKLWDKREDKAESAALGWASGLFMCTDACGGRLNIIKALDILLISRFFFRVVFYMLLLVNKCHVQAQTYCECKY